MSRHLLNRSAAVAMSVAMLFGTVSNVFATVSTDQPDYSPGSVVTISGDNSNGAGYLAGETVDVAVSGPNGYASSCQGTADANGAWSCQVTLSPDVSAVGSYSYTATGATSGVTETGSFTDGAPVFYPTSADRTANTNSTTGFKQGDTVYVGLPGFVFATNRSYRIDVYTVASPSATDAPVASSACFDGGTPTTTFDYTLPLAAAVGPAHTVSLNRWNADGGLCSGNPNNLNSTDFRVVTLKTYSDSGCTTEANSFAPSDPIYLNGDGWPTNGPGTLQLAVLISGPGPTSYSYAGSDRPQTGTTGVWDRCLRYPLSGTPNHNSGTWKATVSTGGVITTQTWTVTSPNAAPGAPGKPSGTSPTQGGFTLSWTAASDYGLPNPPATLTYELQGHRQGGLFATVATGIGTNSYAFGASTPLEGTWVYQVRANDSALNGPFSATSDPIVVDRTAPTFGSCPAAGPFTYGQNGGSVSVGPISASDLALPDSSSGSDVDAGASTLSGSVNTSSVGTKTVTFTAVDNAGNSATKSCDYVVGKATLTVTASSPADGVYGDAVPTITPSYSGFVLGQGPSDLTTQPTCSTTYTQVATSVPGDYPTSCSGGVSSNYDFSYLAGTFHVGKAPLQVTADNQSKLLNAPNPTLTITYGGFVYGQGPADLTTQPTCSTTATQFSPVGTYPITCSGGVSGNYAFTYVPGTLTIRFQVCYLYDTTKSFKAGSTVPIKLYLCDYLGNGDFSSPGVVVNALVLFKLDPKAASTLEDSGFANPDSNFRYDATLGPGGGYIYNLSTKYPSPALGVKNALTTGTYVLCFTVDGQFGYSVQFDLK